MIDPHHLKVHIAHILNPKPVLTMMCIMQVHCHLCEAPNEPDELVPLSGGFGYTCIACGAANVLAPIEAPKVAVLEPTSDQDSGLKTCPKCENQQSDLVACHRCGLVFANANTEWFNTDPLAGHPAGETIRARWAALRIDLNDEAAHHAFIALCAQSNLLEFAGQCYRRITPVGHVEDPQIAGYRQRVINAALLRAGHLEQRATTAINRRMRGLILAGIAAFILLIFTFGYFLLARFPNVMPGR